MSDFSWLTARPIAHRGLHDAKVGRIENTLSAFDAAARAGFPMEMDVHLSADGVVYVFHDDVLDRLTTGQGPVAGRTMAELKAIPMVGTEDRIPTLREVLDLVAGRTGLVVEIKSYFAERQRDLVEATARELATYGGPVVVESFDPRQIQDLAEIAPDLPRGIVADDAMSAEDYNHYRVLAQEELATLSHRSWSHFQFVSYWVKLIGNDVSRKVRDEWKLPVTAWTIRKPDERRMAAEFGAQLVFEGFDPDA
ncbi:glycerophosphodiester phosphodiesterase [Pleomorphomonas diazotrophica]|uniref:Glycerophosphodiester phosphodiesterase n=1 Tax=Pleomorphomonas diazotrophica TaxID=1166257 RepID=A0A1I4QWX7_9HYPH|nr:glycerophosphodiester phosphodiesterase family protein [Pleomorphomonas diazotrophica]PKR90388.1 glycerophosphodiester phosphodiesterase [Pleomorphomonas diazotrophica]SFM44196.1 glycerophosphoryl diester phosphodiesterase [Pleomorphomonas diazotrophica]